MDYVSKDQTVDTVFASRPKCHLLDRLDESLDIFWADHDVDVSSADNNTNKPTGCKLDSSPAHILKKTRKTVCCLDICK